MINQCSFANAGLQNTDPTVTVHSVPTVNRDTVKFQSLRGKICEY